MTTYSHPGFSALIVGLPQVESSALVGELRARGGSCISVADGFEAVKLMAAKPPDILFVDANTLRLDGYALCALARHGAGNRSIRIVLRLGEDSAFESVRAQLSGADFVIKDVLGQGASHAADIALSALR